MVKTLPLQDFPSKKWQTIVQSRLVRWDPKYLGEHKIYEIWSRWSLQNIWFSLQSAGDDHQESDKEAITRLQRCFGRLAASGGHRWSFRKEVHGCGSTRGTMGSVGKNRNTECRNIEIHKCRNAKHRSIEIQKYKRFPEGGVEVRKQARDNRFNGLERNIEVQK